MAERRDVIDKWLMRAKDIIVIVAAVSPILFFGVRLYRVPDIQEAQAETIRAHGGRLDKLETNIDLLSELVIEKKRRENTR